MINCAKFCGESGGGDFDYAHLYGKFKMLAIIILLNLTVILT
jgi:hypothetical protein